MRWKKPGSVYVASFAEAWIEIPSTCTILAPASVASFAEAWIEILLHLWLYR